MAAPGPKRLVRRPLILMVFSSASWVALCSIQIKVQMLSGFLPSIIPQVACSSRSLWWLARTLILVIPCSRRPNRLMTMLSKCTCTWCQSLPTPWVHWSLFTRARESYSSRPMSKAHMTVARRVLLDPRQPRSPILYVLFLLSPMSLPAMTASCFLWI